MELVIALLASLSGVAMFHGYMTPTKPGERIGHRTMKVVGWALLALVGVIIVLRAAL